MSGSITDLQSDLIECILSGGGIEVLSAALSEYFDACVHIRNSENSYVTSACKPTHDTIYTLERDIRAGSSYLGRMSAERPLQPFSDAEACLFDKAAEVVALQLQQEKKIADIEFRLRGNFIEDLISARFADADSIKTRARAIDYDITAPHRVLVAEIDTISNAKRHHNLKDTPAQESLKSELAKAVYSRLNQLSIGMVMHRNDETVILIRIDGSSALSAVKSVAEEIIGFVRAQYNIKMHIGIGSVCTELSDFSKSYHAAKKSLEIGEYMITEGQVRSLEQFSVHALFLSTVKPAELYNYARAHLDKLLTYDKKNGSELLKTLQEYLYLRNNVEKTARALSLSVSGLKYRLTRIEKIIGLELNDYKVSFDLQLALVIMQLYGEYRIRSDMV
jgi:sugar diacid utilization regulator